MTQFAQVANELSGLGVFVASPNSSEDHVCRLLVQMGQAWLVPTGTSTRVYFRENRTRPRA